MEPYKKLEIVAQSKNTKFAISIVNNGSNFPWGAIVESGDLSRFCTQSQAAPPLDDAR
jgi:hypothetical protein